jgi:hypothetical protein
VMYRPLAVKVALTDDRTFSTAAYWSLLVVMKRVGLLPEDWLERTVTATIRLPFNGEGR